MAFWQNYLLNNARFCGDFCLRFTDWCSVMISCWKQRIDQVLDSSSILMRGRCPSHRAHDPNVNIALAKLETCSIWVHVEAGEWLKGWMASIHPFTPGALCEIPKSDENQGQRLSPAGKSQMKEPPHGLKISELVIPFYFDWPLNPLGAGKMFLLEQERCWTRYFIKSVCSGYLLYETASDVIAGYFSPCGNLKLGCCYFSHTWFCILQVVAAPLFKPTVALLTR